MATEIADSVGEAAMTGVDGKVWAETLALDPNGMSKAWVSARVDEYHGVVEVEITACVLSAAEVSMLCASVVGDCVSSISDSINSLGVDGEHMSVPLVNGLALAGGVFVCACAVDGECCMSLTLTMVIGVPGAGESCV